MVERCPDKTEAVGPIPTTPTWQKLKIIKDKQALGGKPAVELFSKISTWIAVPIILALIAGKALDKYYGTAPWMLLILAGIGFATSSFGIVRAVKKFIEKQKKKLRKINPSSRAKLTTGQGINL